MSSFPPPSGPSTTTSARPDPWTEQLRREAEHRAERRRRRRRWLVPAAIVFVLALGGGAAYVALIGDANEPVATSVTAVASTTVPQSPEPTPAPTVPPEQLVAVEEIWLLDRGEGVFDWGLNVFVPAGSPSRSGVTVAVRLVDIDGETVFAVDRVLDGVNAQVPSTVAGHLVDPERAPARLEFDIGVGTPSNDLGLGELLSTRVVERIDDELRGRIRSSARTDVVDVAMVLAWRDDEGALTTAIVYEIERLRPGVDARFAIDLVAEGAPDGLPDDVFWAPSSAG